MSPCSYASSLLDQLALAAVLCLCPSPATAQIIGFFPATDSITIDENNALGRPILQAHVVETPNGIDSVTLKPTNSALMFLGSRSGSLIWQCLFAIRDTADQNHYRLVIDYIYPYPGSQFTIPFDTAFNLVWRQNLRLIVRVGDIDVDSAEVRFHMTSTGIEVESGNGLPQMTRLLPSYPNPFNPSTTISYELARDADVDITIFDALGRSMVTLVRQHQYPGLFHGDVPNLVELRS
jgi:hypothetical protein